jgi:uncharacterized protein (DUF1499 family)
LALVSCAGARPTGLGVKDFKLAACPPTPNCVSSDAADDHAIASFALAQPAPDAWRVAQSALARLPRTTVVTATGDYLHAECRSLVFGFVDDLELHLRPAENIIAVRSAARLGHSDFGVNRRRVDALREMLRRSGALR